MTVSDIDLPTTAAEQTTADQALAEDACPVCPHPMTNHDAISRRYCMATASSNPSRGCVCSESGKHLRPKGR